MPAISMFFGIIIRMYNNGEHNPPHFHASYQGYEAVFNMEELDAVELPYPNCDAKNLFVRDDKRRSYFLITVKGDKRVDLKEFRKTYGTKPLTFVKPDELADILGLTPGSVSPFGLLNDAEKKVVFYLDAAFQEAPGLIGIHPNDNTATVWLKAEDLIRIIEEHGNEVHIMI